MVATALLYSGLPNPRWTVAPSSASEIAAAIKSMPALSRGSKAEGGLGYSGVTLEILTPTQGVATWTIGRGVATLEGRHFADVGRKVEKMILESGRPYINQEILSQLLNE
jgi:hypothetical protein